VTFIDNTVDPTTGTIRLKATFANEEKRLWPGQFVNVTLTLTIDPAAIVIPALAVQSGQQGSQYVFVVKEDSTVENRRIAVEHTHETAATGPAVASAGATAARHPDEARIAAPRPSDPNTTDRPLNPGRPSVRDAGHRPSGVADRPSAPHPWAIC
jgi:multidrug efflux system membrane fusion protein